MQRKTFVYWLHLPEHTDPYSQGYIGVSNQPKIRYQAHIRESKKETYMKNKTLSEAFRKYGKDIQQDILYEGIRTDCLDKERIYRPSDNIGWNKFAGGTDGYGVNMIGSHHSDETKQKISKSNKGKVGTPSKFKGVTNRWSDEQKKLIGSYHKGKTISEAHKQSAREKMLREKSPASSCVDIRHTSNPDLVVETITCIHNFCDKYNVGYSAARSRLRRATQLGVKEYVNMSRISHYFLTYVTDRSNDSVVTN